MFRSKHLRLALAVMAAMVVVAPSTERGVQAHAEDYRIGATATSGSISSPKPCSDRAYQLTGAKQARTLQWSFQASSTPAGLGRSATVATLKRAFANIVNGRNDCGRSDSIGATARYLGTTSRAAKCNSMDGRNIIGFGALSEKTLALTCWWTVDGQITEVDIQINSRLPWATSLASCHKDYMLEAVMTHEVGHAFGVGHVAEASHGRLTMSTTSDGMCNNSESTLGLGDLLALEALY